MDIARRALDSILSSRVGRMNDTENVAARGQERSCANAVR